MNKCVEINIPIFNSNKRVKDTKIKQFIWNLIKSFVHLKGTAKKEKKALFLQQNLKNWKSRLTPKNFNFFLQPLSWKISYADQFICQCSENVLAAHFHVKTSMLILTYKALNERFFPLLVLPAWATFLLL